MPEGVRDNANRMHNANIRSFQAALKAGVPIAAGSDLGASFMPHGTGAQELILMVRHGMTPLQAISSSTHVAARALGLGDEIGLIKTGMVADLVLVDGDPSTDISCLEDQNRIKVVMRSGRVMVDRTNRRLDAEESIDRALLYEAGL